MKIWNEIKENGRLISVIAQVLLLISFAVISIFGKLDVLQTQIDIGVMWILFALSVVSEYLYSKRIEVIEDNRWNDVEYFAKVEDRLDYLEDVTSAQQESIHAISNRETVIQKMEKEFKNIVKKPKKEEKIVEEVVEVCQTQEKKKIVKKK